MNTPPPKEAAIAAAKGLRKEFDATLQVLKEYIASLPGVDGGAFEDKGEVIANAKLAQRHAEDAIMRLGMVLKNIGNPTPPYPESYDPESTRVDPPADNLKF